MFTAGYLDDDSEEFIGFNTDEVDWDTLDDAETDLLEFSYEEDDDIWQAEIQHFIQVCMCSPNYVLRDIQLNSLSLNSMQR